jgi:hypothetical protein
MTANVLRNMKAITPNVSFFYDLFCVQSLILFLEHAGRMGDGTSARGLVLKPLVQENSRASTSHGSREQNSRASTGHGPREQQSKASSSHAHRENAAHVEHSFSSARAKQSENLRSPQHPQHPQHLSAAELAQRNLNSLLRESTANGNSHMKLKYYSHNYMH